MIERPPDVQRFDVLNQESFPDFLVQDRRAIAQLLQTLAERHVLMSAHIGEHGASFVTTVLGMGADGASVILDASAEERLNDRASRAAHLICVTRLDGIRIQFRVTTPQRIELDGLPALGAPLPESVLRLQRREFFRIAVPMTSPVSCTIAATTPNREPVSVKLRVIDISSGGIAVLIPPDTFNCSVGMEFEDSQLQLPDTDPITVTLKVRNMINSTSRHGVTALRAGCEFLGLSGKANIRIQRYIFQVQRERRALETGD